jgi:hypothetical protein
MGWRARLHLRWRWRALSRVQQGQRRRRAANAERLSHCVRPEGLATSARVGRESSTIQSRCSAVASSSRCKSERGNPEGCAQGEQTSAIVAPLCSLVFGAIQPPTAPVRHPPSWGRFFACNSGTVVGEGSPARRRLAGNELTHNLMGIGGLWANIRIVPGRPRHVPV